MQMGEVVGFNDYRNYRILGETGEDNITCSKTRRNADKQSFADRNEHRRKVNIRKENSRKDSIRKDNRKERDNIKKCRRKERKSIRRLKAAIVIAFLFIIYTGYHMLSYIVDNSFATNSADFSTVRADSDRMLSESFGAGNADWKLILVNKDNAVPDDYEIELTTLRNDVKVDSRIYPDLQDMFDEMRNEGIYPVVGEGYRTHEEQKQMMQDKIDAYRNEGYSKAVAKKLAKEWVAVPGTSEHELGIALDINADKNMTSTDQEVYDWLSQNAYRYGFILRYPQDKESVTGIDYEPWHYRYVGKEAAKAIYDNGLTLEEYVN